MSAPLARRGVRALMCGLIWAASAAAAPVQAATLETLVSAFSPRVGAKMKASPWTALDGVHGIEWQDPAPKTTPAGLWRSGAIGLDELGRAGFYLEGDTAGASVLTVSVPQLVEKTAFFATLRRQLPNKKVIVTPVRESCPDEGALMGTAVYRLGIPQREVVFVHIATDAGGQAGNPATEFTFGLKLQPYWRCVP